MLHNTGNLTDNSCYACYSYQVPALLHTIPTRSEELAPTVFTTLFQSYGNGWAQRDKDRVSSLIWHYGRTICKIATINSPLSSSCSSTWLSSQMGGASCGTHDCRILVSGPMELAYHPRGWWAFPLLPGSATMEGININKYCTSNQEHLAQEMVWH